LELITKKSKDMSGLSDCCGAEEWLDDTGICGSCMEHADWNDDEEDEDLDDDENTQVD
jgi:hypothetical protein